MAPARGHIKEAAIQTAMKSAWLLASDVRYYATILVQANSATQRTRGRAHALHRHAYAPCSAGAAAGGASEDVCEDATHAPAARV